MPHRKRDGSVMIRLGSLFSSPRPNENRRALPAVAAFVLPFAFGLFLGMCAQAPRALAKPDISKLVKPRNIVIRARPIGGFDRRESKRVKFGDLQWIGGLKLTSTSNYHGGFSGIAIGEDGSSFLTVSDAGFWLSGKIEYRGGRPIGVSGTQVGPLRTRSGRVLAGVRETDAESVAFYSGSPERGEVLISFERIHRIGAYKVAGGQIIGKPRYLKLPSYLSSLHQNSGLESVAVIKFGPLRGSVVTFAQSRRDKRGRIRGWLIKGGKSRELFLQPMEGFDVTDIAALPDGGLLILERRFRLFEGVKMRIRKIAANGLRPGRTLVGKVLFQANSRYRIDNMEGIAVHRSNSGETIITLISDDNFRFLQDTILLQFKLLSAGVRT